MKAEKILPRASIIIIAYNDETHVEAAIKSACGQTEEKIEILCVDDGSTDSTRGRMLRCAEKDSRIRVITRENGGILAARAAGLAQAAGRYAFFLDSDDRLVPEAVKTACDAADAAGADVLEFGVQIVESSENPLPEGALERLERWFSQDQPIPPAVTGPELVNACFEKRQILWNAWNKLYDTELLRRALQEYRGERICMCEDMLLSLMVLCHAAHYARIPDRLYAYTVGSGMTTGAAGSASSDAVKRRGVEWLALKLARDWLKRIGCPQREIADAMEAFEREVRGNTVFSLTERYSSDARAAYLDRLAQICSEKELAEILGMCLEHQQGLAAGMEESSRELRRVLADRENRLEEQKNRLACFEESSRELRRVLADRENRLEEQKNRLACFEESSRELRRALADRENELQEQRGQIARLEEKGRKLDRIMTELEEGIPVPLPEADAAPAFETAAACKAACEDRGGAVFGEEYLTDTAEKRALLVSHELSLTGAPIVLFYLALSLKKLGWKPVVISPLAGPLQSEYVREGMPVLTCPGLFQTDLIPRAAGLFGLIVLNTADCAHVADLLNGRDTPVLWWVHEAAGFYQTEYAPQMPDRLCANMKVVTAGPWARRLLLQHCPGYQAEELFYWIPDDTGAGRRGKRLLSRKADGKRVFALVGSIERRKGQDILLDAIARLPESIMQSCFFVFAGVEHESDLAAQLRRSAEKNPESIQYIPQIPRAEMPGFYAEIDCLICASRDDPLPVVVAEACRHARTVICSEHTGTAPYLEQAGAGITYRHDDADELAQRIAWVCSQDGKKLAGMQARARALYLSLFSPEAFRKRLETEILPALTESPVRPPQGDGETDLLLRHALAAKEKVFRAVSDKNLLIHNRNRVIERQKRMLTDAEERARQEQAQMRQQLADERMRAEQQLADERMRAEQQLADEQARAGQQREYMAQLLAGAEEKAGQQQATIARLEEQNRSLSESFETISNAFFWKITKPARFTLDVTKWMLRPHAQKGLMRKGLDSLGRNGLRVTWQKAMQTIYFGDSYAQIARQALFSETELARQREQRFPRTVRFSILVPLYNTRGRYLREMIESVRAQTYADWELCLADGSDAGHAEVERICREYAEEDRRVRYRRLEKNRGISGNTNACLEMAEGEYIALFDHDDRLHPAALFEVMRAICEKSADFIYTDESIFYDSPEDAGSVHFKPDYAPDTLCSNNYICHFSVFRRALLDGVGLFDPACDGSQDHDMILRLTEKAGRIAHIPEVLYYWRASENSVARNPGAKSYTVAAGIKAVEKRLARLGQEGTVSAVRPGMTIYRIRYAVPKTAKVSILIPADADRKSIRTCLDSVFRNTTWPDYEVVVVEGAGSTDSGAADDSLTQGQRENLQLLVWDGAENDAAIRNFGARHCTGDYLLLLSGDTEVLTPDWIEEMLMFAQRPDVGAVGAKICFRDDTVCQAGLSPRPDGGLIRLFAGVPRESVGYMGRLLYAQNLSAVSGDCMLMRREVWDRVNGLDENYGPVYGAADLCMRIRETGALVVWTPFAELYAGEAGSGQREAAQKRQPPESERIVFRNRWKAELEKGDPYFNPNFDQHRTDFAVDPSVRRHDAN